MAITANDVKGGIYRIRFIGSQQSYIGQAVNLERRRKRHLRDLSAGVSHCRGLQAGFRKYGVSMLLYEVLEFTTPNNLTIREQFWIDRFGIDNLYNIRPLAASPLGMKMPLAAIERIRAKNTGKKRSPEAVERIRAACRSHEPAIRAKIGAAGRGRKHSEETKDKMRAAHLGKLFSPEHRKNLSLSRIGMKFTEEHRNNLRLAFLGKPRARR